MYRYPRASPMAGQACRSLFVLTTTPFFQTGGFVTEVCSFTEIQRLYTVLTTPNRLGTKQYLKKVNIRPEPPS